MSDCTQSAPSIAIVGASGAVGQEAIGILESRGHPAHQLKLFGSARSANTKIRFLDSHLPIEHLDTITHTHHDFVLLCANAEVSKLVRAQLNESRSILIDNSSAFRMDPDVPLVIPEVNAHLLDEHPRVIANPNCSTIMLLVAINPLRDHFGIRSVIVSTYQAVSGAGLSGINELRDQAHAYLEGKSIPTKVFPSPCAFNVFEHESAIDPASGFNGEESKIINETRRIWNDPTLSILPTCVRVPVERAHSQSIVVELERSTTIQEIRQVLKRDGIEQFEESKPLTPRDASGKNDVFVGRIRIDPQSEGKRVLLWICADQIRKGAALNSIQILDHLHARRVETGCSLASPLV